MPNPLDVVIRANKAGHRAGLTSVCSAHPIVLAAAIQEAISTGTLALIEATSNQVDQFGGYTGMRPSDFRDLVHSIADQQGLPRNRVLLGGDHLGPNRWQHEPASTAMPKAEELIRAYASAGYTKLHLDCSMPLAGDPKPLPQDVVAARAVQLLAAAHRAAPDPGAVRYVIGTEVPVPGGAHETIEALTVTAPSAAGATLHAHRDALQAAGLEHLWPQVAALVVQPGVEFDHLHVIDYDPAGTERLHSVLDNEPTMVFEAHSTDYQLGESLEALVRDHWAVLKVGPGLTFALREGLVALAEIEEHLVPVDRQSRLLEEIEDVMRQEPGLWEQYYEGTADEQRIARRFSYSDRMRYYLPHPRIAAAIERLLDNLRNTEIPEPLVSQYLPMQYVRVRQGQVSATADALLLDRVRDALRPYSTAVRYAPTTQVAEPIGSNQ